MLRPLYLIGFMLSANIVAESTPATPTAPTGLMSFTEIANRYLPSFGVVEKPITKEELDKLEERKKNLEVLQDVPTLTEYQKIKMVYQMFATQEDKADGNIPNTVHEALRQLTKDLDLFYGQGQEVTKHLMSKIDNSTTVFGTVMLSKMLTEPQADVRKLSKRQELIKKLVNDKKFFKEVEAQLTELKKIESQLLSYWAEKDAITEEVIKLFYFPPLLSTLNTNPLLLGLLKRLNDLSCGMLALNGVGFGSLIAVGLPWLGSQNGYADQVVPIAIGSTIGGTALAGLYIKMAKGLFVRIHQTLGYLQKRLMGVARLIDTADFVAEHRTALKDGLTGFKFAANLVSGGQGNSDECNQLVEMLRANTFKGEPSPFFSHSSNILGAHHIMDKDSVKAEFVETIKAIGELDACLSVAKLVKKFEKNRVGFCFVEYSDETKPYMNFTNFWNLFVNPDVVVTNSIEIGKSGGPRNLIITGGNTGGKSTILKAIIINLLLARLGIAAADEAVITPFLYLGTSLNVSDDVTSGTSLFKAEALRAKAIINDAKSLRRDQFGCIAIDELFVGTDADKGADAVTKVAKLLDSYPNVIFFLSTHAPRVTELEKETNGSCKNYKVEIHKDAQGNLIRPFKLEEGVNTSNVADDILDRDLHFRK